MAIKLEVFNKILQNNSELYSGQNCPSDKLVSVLCSNSMEKKSSFVSSYGLMLPCNCPK